VSDATTSARSPLRRVARGLALLGVGTALGVGSLLVVLSTETGNRALLRFALGQVNDSLDDAWLSVGGLHSDLWDGVVLRRVELSDLDGGLLFSADRVVLTWDLSGLLRRRILIEQLRLDHPTVDLGLNPDSGRLALLDALGVQPSADDAPTQPWQGLDGMVLVEAAEVRDGRLRFDGGEVDDLQLDARLEVEGRRAALSDVRVFGYLRAGVEGELGLDADLTLDSGDLDIGRLALRYAHSTVSLSGTVRSVEMAPVFDLSLEAPRLLSADLSQLMRQEGAVAVDVGLGARLRGPLHDLGASLAVDAGAAGRIEATAEGDLEASPALWGLQVGANALDLDAACPGLLGTELRIAHADLSVAGVGDELVDDATVVVRADFAGVDVAGEHLSSVRSHLALEDGDLVVDELLAVHGAGAVAASGRVLLDRKLVELDIDADLPELSALSVLAATPLSGSARWTPHISVAYGEELRVVGGGRLQALALGVAGVHLSQGSGPLGLDYGPDGLRLDGNSRLRQLDLDPVDVGSGRVAWSVAVPTAGGVQVGADVELVDVRSAALAGSLDAVTGRVDVEVPDAGELRLAAALDVSGVRTTADAAPGAGPVQVSMVGDRLEASLGVRLPGGGDLLVGKVHGRGDRWTLEELSVAPLPGLSWRAEGPVIVELGDGAPVRVEGVLVGPSGRLQVSSDPGVGGWQVTADRLDLGALSRLSALLAVDPLADAAAESGGDKTPPISGVADLDLAVVMPRGEALQSLDGALRVGHLGIPDLVDDVDLGVAVGGPPDRPDLALDLWHDDALLATARGSVPLDLTAVDLACGEPISLELVLAPNELSALRARLLTLPELEGRVSADLRASGSVCDPDLSLVGVAQLPLGAGGERVRLDLEASRAGDVLDATAYLEEGFSRRVRIQGDAETALGELLERLHGGGEIDDALLDRLVGEFTLALEPRNVSLEALRAFLDLPEGLAGRVGGGVFISGSPAAPQVQGALLLLEGQLGKVKVSQGGLTVWPDADGYHGQLQLGWAGAPTEDTRPDSATALGSLPTPAARPRALSVDAFLPLRPDESLEQAMARDELDVRLDGVLPLAVLEGVVDGLSEAEGDLAFDAVAGGSISEPTLRSSLSMTGGAFTWLPLGLRYEDIELQARATDRGVELTRVFMRDSRRWSAGLRELSKARSLTLQGSIELEDYRPGLLSLDAELDRFWILGNADRTLAVTGPVHAEGRWPELRVAGAVDVNESLMDFGGSLFGADTTLGLDPSIQLWRDGALVTAGRRAPPQPAVWQGFDLDLDIDLLRNVRLIVEVPTAEDYGEQLAQLSKVSLDAELGGEVKLRQVAGALSLQGEIETLRGTSTLLGASFDLSGGTISFLGDGYDNPLVDINAVRSTSYGNVDVHVSGFVDDLDIVPSSDDYPDQLDVVSLLLFGKPASAFTGGDAQTKIDALGLAMASLTGQLERALGTSVVDELEIDPAGAIRIGKALSDRVFLRLESTTNNVETEGNRTSVTLEYLITRRMYAEFSTGDKGASSASLFWRWRF